MVEELEFKLDVLNKQFDRVRRFKSRVFEDRIGGCEVTCRERQSWI